MAQETVAIIILVGVFLVLLASRVSVAVSMGLAAAATYIYLDLPLELVVQYTVGGVSNFTFMAVPFFILSGELINQGGIGYIIDRHFGAESLQVLGVTAGKEGGQLHIGILTDRQFRTTAQVAVAHNANSDFIHCNHPFRGSMHIYYSK